MLIADCNAYDLILVRSHEDDNKISCSETLFRFGSILASSAAADNNAASSKNSKLEEAADSRPSLSVYLLVVSPIDGSTLRLPIRNNVIHSSRHPTTTMTVRTTHDTAALQRLASCLRPGRNRARYLLVRGRRRRRQSAPTHCGNCCSEYLSVVHGRPAGRHRRRRYRHLIDHEGISPHGHLRGLFARALPPRSLRVSAVTGGCCCCSQLLRSLCVSDQSTHHLRRHHATISPPTAAAASHTTYCCHRSLYY